MKKLLIVLAMVLVPSIGLAASLHVGDEVDLNENVKNSYVFSQNVNVGTSLSGDTTIFSQYIKIDKDIERDLFAFGTSIDISGNVGGSIRGGGNTFNFAGVVKEDLLVGAATANLSSGSIVEGDLWAGANIIIIDGTIKGNAKIAASKVTINGTISGDAEINAREIIVGDSAKIGGSLTYWSGSEGKLSEKASIAKGPYFNKLESNYSNTARNITYSLLSLIILALAISYGFRRFTEKIKGVDFGSFIRNIGWGILTILIVPVISIIILSISVHLGLVLTTSYLTFLILSYGISAIYMGAIIQKLIQKDKEFSLDWITVLIGGFAYIAVGYIPIVGNTIQIAIYLASFGYLMNKAYSIISLKSAKTKSSK